MPTPFAAPTDFGFTGQRLLDPGLGGLMDYRARFYSPYLNRFIQPDTLIPGAGNPQAWNRYAYVLNSPVKYNDPSGHGVDCGIGENCRFESPKKIIPPTGGDTLGTVKKVASVAGATIDYWNKHPWIVKDGMVQIPIAFPSGYGYDVSTVLQRLQLAKGHPSFYKEGTQVMVAAIPHKWIRVLGRLGDDLVPITALFGWAVTIYPEQAENFANGASLSEHLIDYYIDSGGFITSEIAGDIVTVKTAPFLGPFSVPAGLVIDGGVGVGWDYVFDNLGVRESIVNLVVNANDVLQAPFRDPNRLVPVPVPTAPLYPNIPQGTPSP